MTRPSPVIELEAASLRALQHEEHSGIQDPGVDQPKSVTHFVGSDAFDVECVLIGFRAEIKGWIEDYVRIDNFGVSRCTTQYYGLGSDGQNVLREKEFLISKGNQVDAIGGRGIG